MVEIEVQTGSMLDGRLSHQSGTVASSQHECGGGRKIGILTGGTVF